MKPIYLERHDPDKNLHRFYQLFITHGIFGDWSLVKEWGRAGSPGTVRKDWLDIEAEARGKIMRRTDKGNQHTNSALTWLHYSWTASPSAAIQSISIHDKETTVYDGIKIYSSGCFC